MALDSPSQDAVQPVIDPYVIHPYSASIVVFLFVDPLKTPSSKTKSDHSTSLQTLAKPGQSKACRKHRGQDGITLRQHGEAIIEVGERGFGRPSVR